MVSADIHFPDSVNFKVDIVDQEKTVTGEVATLRFKTNAGYVSMHLFHDCQIDAIVDCLLTYKTNHLVAGNQGGPVC